MLTVITAALYVVGLVLTGWGLFNAVISTQRDIIKAKDRIPQLQRLEAKQRAETKQLEQKRDADRAAKVEVNGGAQLTPEEHEAWHAQWKPVFAEMHIRHDSEHGEHGFVRATLENLPHLAQHESQWLLQRILDSNRWNLVLVGSGLVVTTIASISSLFLP
ncbi:hypothetical protein [Microbacterium amylolyticum]|uniref:Chromosome condensin MukBEF ATPase and DNA-binding subunit MukB n=1 Tax=Microbacterium amylolyticum TaxID=936337 RepID=A0ABS4ZF37_9MICO|nr:hypothetical protein [Microbacterium amylolyticum]MBP2435898.1 chromosome condensin MukBEF ATPase and DNA-binding subunit MukB [Microbacterium amylolyticum]